MSELYGHTTGMAWDIGEGGEWFAKHMDHMTREGLHSKADIAAELAYRDTHIQQLESLAKAVVEARKACLNKRSLDADADLFDSIKALEEFMRGSDDE